MFPPEIQQQIFGDILDSGRTFGRFRRAGGQVPELLQVQNWELHVMSKKIWLENNEFVLSALPIPWTATACVQKKNIIRKNDVGASIQWVTYMVKYTSYIKASIVCTENPQRIVPFFFDIMKAVYQRGLRVTINGVGVRAPTGPLQQRGVDFQFTGFSKINELLLNLLGLACVAKDLHQSLDQLESQYNDTLVRKKCTPLYMKPSIFRSINRYDLPFGVVAWEGPLDLLYPDEKTALFARQRVDKGLVEWADGKTPYRNKLTHEWITHVLECLHNWFHHLDKHLRDLKLALHASPQDLQYPLFFIEVPFTERYNQDHPLYASQFTQLPKDTVFGHYGREQWTTHRPTTVRHLAWHIAQCKKELDCVRRHYDAMYRHWR